MVINFQKSRFRPILRLNWRIPGLFERTIVSRPLILPKAPVTLHDNNITIKKKIKKNHSPIKCVSGHTSTITIKLSLNDNDFKIAHWSDYFSAEQFDRFFRQSTLDNFFLLR